jgi:acyl carrier protein
MDTEFTQVIEPFLPLLGGTVLTEDSRLRDFGLDSIKSIDLLMALEDRYGFEFPADKLTDSTFETAGSLWAVIDSVADPGQPVGPGASHA